MTSPPWVLDAPWLQSRPACIDAALGSALWLWMHDMHRRQALIQDMEHRLLAPITAGQYVLARGPCPCLGEAVGERPLALLLFARFDEQAEARHVANPEGRIATREWCSGDRLWLIDWSAPFGHTLALRRSMLRLVQGQRARSTLVHRAGRHTAVTFNTNVTTLQDVFNAPGSPR